MCSFLSVCAALFPSLSAPGAVMGVEDEPELKLLHEHPFVGDVWVAYRLTVPDDPAILLEITKEVPEHWFGANGTWILDGEGAILSEYPYGWSRTTRGVEVWFEDPSGERRGTRIAGSSSGWATGSYLYPPSAGTYTVVFVDTHAGAQTGSTRLSASSGTELVNASSGVAFLATDEEFDGTELAVTAGDTRIRSTAGASHQETLSHRFFGRFTGATSRSDLAYDGPQGTIHGRSSFVFSGAEPGTYTFRIVQEPTVAQADRHDPWMTFVMGADVQLP